MPEGEDVLLDVVEQAEVEVAVLLVGFVHVELVLVDGKVVLEDDEDVELLVVALLLVVDEVVELRDGIAGRLWLRRRLLWTRRMSLWCWTSSLSLCSLTWVTKRESLRWWKSQWSIWSQSLS